MLYPLKFKSVEMKKVWGAESWEIACNETLDSSIANGEYKGMSIGEVVKDQQEQILGSEIKPDWFPLLIKTIDAKNRLSIQVHPDEKYAKEHNVEHGKNEVWIVLEAEPGAEIILGAKGCPINGLLEAIQGDDLRPFLNKVKVKAGDVIYVESGMVHSIGSGIKVLEIQDNSDITFRVDDFNRGRHIHLYESTDAIRLEKVQEPINVEKTVFEDYQMSQYQLHGEFSLEILEIDGDYVTEAVGDHFTIYTCLEGQGEINYEGGTTFVQQGESVMIPASLGFYSISGNVKLVKTYSKQHQDVQEQSAQENEYVMMQPMSIVSVYQGRKQQLLDPKMKAMLQEIDEVEANEWQLLRAKKTQIQ